MSRNEAVLYERPDQLDALLVDSAEQLLGLLDEDGVVLRANRALAAFCTDDLVGRPLWAGPGWIAAGLACESTQAAIASAVRGSPAHLVARTPATGFGTTDIEFVFRAASAKRDRAASAPPRYVVVEGRRVPRAPAGTGPHTSAAEPQERIAQLEAVFERAPIGLALVDCDLRFLLVNSTLAAISGLPANDHRQRSLREVLPDLADTLEVLCSAVIQHGEPVQHMVLRTRPEDGAENIRQWSVDLYPWHDVQGRIAGAVAAVIETTELAHAESARQEREQQFKSFFDSAPVGLFVLDQRGQCLRVNDRFAAVHGISADEHLGQSLAALGSPYAEPVARAYRRFQEGSATPLTFELSSARQPGGTARHWSLSCFPLERGPRQPFWLGGFVLDVTEARQVKQALLRRTDDLAKAQSLARLTHWELVVEGDSIRWPEEIWTLAGYPPAAPDGAPRDPESLFSASSWPAVRRTLSEALRTGEPFQLDAELVRADGARIWIATRGECERGSDGRVTRLRGFAQDITDAKQATARVVRLSRLYAAISETNKAIARAATPDEVYRAVCAACIEFAGFRLAWIGVADPEVQRVVPVEAAGPATGFLDDLVISTREDLPEGRGPTARAYRHQCVTECRDLPGMLEEAQHRAAAHAARSQDLQCALSMPLRRGGEPFGTLTVYGPEAHFFEEEAIRLLRDMADSVSFALDLADLETLRRQTESALRASEARLQEAQAISKMGDWELERDSGRMSWSPQLFRLFERRMALGAPDLNEALAYYTEESLEKTRDCFWHVIDTGERAEIEQVVVLPSGRHRYHATVIVPVEGPTGRVSKLYGTVQDITDRKLAERELVRRTEEVEDLYQNAPCGYHSLDAEGRIIRINDTALQWLGYTREEVFGNMTAYDVFTAESQHAFEQDFRRLVASGESRTLELELRRKDGSALPVLASSTAIVSAQGEFVAARMTLADDSHRKLLERERAAYVARLAELSQHLIEVQESERRQLASDLHDHASPNLAALRITFGNLVAALPASVSETLEPLLDDAYALLRDTTNGIRDICTDLRPATLDYAGLIPALREYAEQFGRRTGVAVTIDHPAHEVALPASVQSLLFRITQEALTNAAKHALATSIRIRLEDTPAAVTLGITDDGIGFDPDQLGERGGSSGLGLIIMKERAEFAGGHFNLRSMPGKGTEITVVFDHPVEDGARSRPPSSSGDTRTLQRSGPTA